MVLMVVIPFLQHYTEVMLHLSFENCQNNALIVAINFENVEVSQTWSLCVAELEEAIP
jgi:hypothetical protein